MKIAIVQFPGSNCERETAMAVQRVGMQAVPFLWNESPEKLQQCDGFVIVGGFSYEDRSRSGILAALDPMIAVIKKQSELGKPLLGICNGAQILVEAGLVPGFQDYPLSLALAENKRMQQGQVLATGYYNAWVQVRMAQNSRTNAFTRHLSPTSILQIPIAHAEGRFVIPAPLLATMQQQGMLALQYCDAQGELPAEFPINPNGSVANIAAISNVAGNVMAIMPHPERSEQGDVLFASMRDYIAQGIKPIHLTPLTNWVLPPIQTRSVSAANTASDSSSAVQEWIIESLVTDNHAISVQSTLRRLGLQVGVTRANYWYLQGDVAEFSKLQHNGVLFNERKEKQVMAREWLRKNSHKQDEKSSVGNNQQEQKNNHVRQCFLVQAREDILGQNKQQRLRGHFGIQGLKQLQHGVLWCIDSEQGAEVMQRVLDSHILFNPFTHDCYQFS